MKTGRVIKSTGSWYEVLTETGPVRARLRGKFKQQGLKLTNPVAVGDQVTLQAESQQETYTIQEIAPRENYVIRKSTRKAHHAHIIASNIDQAFLMVTIQQPRTSLGFIDRFLVSTESFRIPTTILVNKADLPLNEAGEELLQDLHEIYEPLGYPVLELSALHEQDLLEGFGPLLRGKTTLLSGHSGVGKSTLLNQLVPGARQTTKDISAYSAKGVHTTTFAEMFAVEGLDAFLIDTPGIKEFGVLDIEEQELSHYFVEMRQYLGECKYHNCRHVSEPGCRIIERVEEGYIHPYRYENYVNLLHEEDTHR
ncbi:GTPase RsgA [Nitritalea halalkaliphila LW7]|uniref:Small ribosomal subunit biogenesis GTPase RsgA n=1 Tax=Nitritalea halalkaliphila LW7 TaxID=1189621 RepID=I5BZ63_9BACT|nr:ribosome small subunit-dependent GTPase A [Nitritalea halalkaliphila]EIM74865.1 GTPase RsgA [Nitritalea halalkaliphila LW7]